MEKIYFDAIKRIRELGEVELLVLTMISDKPFIGSASNLAHCLGKDVSNTNKVIKSLESRGYITVVRCPLGHTGTEYKVQEIRIAQDIVQKLFGGKIK